MWVGEIFTGWQPHSHLRKRVFILGPSHVVFLNGCALTTCAKYRTPLRDLIVDVQVNAELAATNSFEPMSTRNEEAEHSIEMQLPLIAKVNNPFNRLWDQPPPSTPLHTLRKTLPKFVQEGGSGRLVADLSWARRFKVMGDRQVSLCYLHATYRFSLPLSPSLSVR